MENIKIDTNRYLKTVSKGPRTFREDLIEQYREKINGCRVGTTYKPMSYVAVMSKVKHLSDFDLGWFFRECSKADNFSKCFFGRLKLKK